MKTITKHWLPVALAIGALATSSAAFAGKTLDGVKATRSTGVRRAYRAGRFLGWRFDGQVVGTRC